MVGSRDASLGRIISIWAWMQMRRTSYHLSTILPSQQLRVNSFRGTRDAVYVFL